MNFKNDFLKSLLTERDRLKFATRGKCRDEYGKMMDHYSLLSKLFVTMYELLFFVVKEDLYSCRKTK